MNELVKWIVSYFRSPDRVAPIELYEKSIAMNRITLDELQDAQKERTTLWNEQKIMHDEILDLRRQEQVCQANQREMKTEYEREVRKLTERIEVLEALTKR